MKSGSKILAMAICLIVMAETTGVFAAEPTRTLNGHAFIPSEVVRSPFALSYFSTRTGGGVAFNLKTPFIDLDGQYLSRLV